MPPTARPGFGRSAACGPGGGDERVLAAVPDEHEDLRTSAGHGHGLVKVDDEQEGTLREGADGVDPSGPGRLAAPGAPPMDYATYRKAFFSDPAPEPRYGYAGMRGFSVSVEDHAAALAFYTEVLGPPAYVEGEDTHGWRLGDAWFTLFACDDGGPSNCDVSLEMASPAEAERLHAALLAAGAMGEDPSDQIMYVPLRFCMATDPFGLQWIVYAPLT